MSMIYADATQTRFFLLPEGADLPAGDLTISSLTGKSLRLDAAAAARFEISETEAKAHVEEKVRTMQALVGRALSALAGAKPGDLPAALKTMLATIGIAEGELPTDRKELGALLGDRLMDISLDRLKAM